MATPAQLIDNSNCLACIPRGYQLQVLIYLFATIAGVPTDAQTLVNNARCLECIPVGSQMEVLISLADQILTSSSLSASEVTCGVGAPTSTPASGCAFYIDTSNDAVYIYRSGAWILKV